MQLCAKCHKNEATVHLTRQAGDDEKVSVSLCEGCYHPVRIRFEAFTHGQQKCEFCGGTAFSPLPGVKSIIYACCGCRSDYARIFFEKCATEHPDLIQRSKRDISYFDMCFDPEVAAWSDVGGREAIQKLKYNRQQN